MGKNDIISSGRKLSHYNNRRSLIDMVDVQISEQITALFQELVKSGLMGYGLLLLSRVILGMFGVAELPYFINARDDKERKHYFIGLGFLYYVYAGSLTGKATLVVMFRYVVLVLTLQVAVYLLSKCFTVPKGKNSKVDLLDVFLSDGGQLGNLEEFTRYRVIKDGNEYFGKIKDYKNHNGSYNFNITEEEADGLERLIDTLIVGDGTVIKKYLWVSKEQHKQYAGVDLQKYYNYKIIKQELSLIVGSLLTSGVLTLLVLTH